MFRASHTLLLFFTPATSASPRSRAPAVSRSRAAVLRPALVVWLAA